MLTRRLVLTALAATAATAFGPAFGQGKKTSGAPAPAKAVIAGTYKALGRNPDGSEYDGVCDVTQTGDAVEFAWTINGDTNRGSGVIEGRVVTVDWGDATPVVYVMMPDGTLHGTWADGLALERLTPQ